MTEKERDLRALSEAALQVENALEMRDKLIRQYREEGYSLRDLANAVAMSHEKVRHIVSSGDTYERERLRELEAQLASGKYDARD